MTWYETAFGAHYSWLYAHRDQVEAEACVATLAARDYLSMGVILDLGCGEGRHLSDLSARPTVPLRASPRAQAWVSRWA